MNIYIDGVFDLFHYGHLMALKKAKNLYPNVYLIVGVLSDKVAEDYKRLPIINEKHRYEIIENIKIVDKIIKDAPLEITKEFMDTYNIDLIVHGFSNINDADNQDICFKYPKSINKFQEIKYTTEISTSDIIKKIKDENYL